MMRTGTRGTRGPVSAWRSLPDSPVVKWFILTVSDDGWACRRDPDGDVGQRFADA